MDNTPPCRHPNFSRNSPSKKSLRMGGLAEKPQNFNFHGSINFNQSAVGMFVGPHPPAVEYVQHIVESRWRRRGFIRVHRSGLYYIFECSNSTDLAAIVRFRTAFFNGRIINLRRYNRSFIPQFLNFDSTSLWVRIHGLPFLYLTREWAVSILSHVGYIDEFEFTGEGLPPSADMRVKMVVDLTQPLIPGCFVPVEGEHVIWVHFRYEGIFCFCKNCGFAGHSESSCKIDEEVATRRLKSCVAALESHGMRVLYGPRDYSYYTNLVKGLPNYRRYRDPEANLVRPEEPEDVPMEDRNLPRDIDSNSENFFNNSAGSVSSESYYTGSKHNSDSSSESLDPSESQVCSPPGTRLGLNSDPYASFFPSARARNNGPARALSFSECLVNPNPSVCIFQTINPIVPMNGNPDSSFGNGDCDHDLSLNLNTIPRRSNGIVIREGLTQISSMNAPIQPPATAKGKEIVAAPSTYEIGESSKAPTLFYRHRLAAGMSSHPPAPIIAPAPLALPQPSTKLLHPTPEPTVDIIISPTDNDVTNVANCFIQAGRALARSLRLSGSKVHPYQRASVPPFLPYSPSSFGGNLPNLPLNEFDPPNSPATPVAPINIDDLFNSPIPPSAQSMRKRKNRGGGLVVSDGGCDFRECFFDLSWGERRRYATLNGLSDKGGFNFWKSNSKGSKDLVSKAITDEDMARIWSVQVDADIMESVKKRRRSPSLESTGSSAMRPRQPIFSQNLSNAAVGMDWEANQQLVCSDLIMLDEVAASSQPPSGL